MVPDNEDDGRPNPFGSSVTLEEMEADSAAESAAPTDLDKVKADGDTVPEAYRGKSFAEVIKIAETARETMNESTRAAQEAREAAARAEAAAGRQPAPAPEPIKELSREELKALYDEDPLQAIAVMQDQSMRRAEAHVEQRLSAITEGTVGQAENWARQEFADEFELFGTEIKKMVDGISNKQVFASKQGWQDAVAYVRGKAGNFEKLVEHRQTKASREEAGNARQGERDRSGFTGRNNAGAPRSRDVSNSEAEKGMSSEEKQIAQRFIDDGTFKNMAEYRQWQRMGG